MTTRGYNVIRATLNGITHVALLWWNRHVIMRCGQHCGLGEIHGTSEGVAGMPVVNCMSCLVAEART